MVDNLFFLFLDEIYSPNLNEFKDLEKKEIYKKTLHRHFGITVPKSQNYIGTQLADLILYPAHDCFIPNHNVRNDHFINCEKHLKKKIYGQVTILPSLQNKAF